MNPGNSLDAYLARHPAEIAFEGLDPFLGRPVDLDPADQLRAGDVTSSPCLSS